MRPMKTLLALAFFVLVGCGDTIIEAPVDTTIHKYDGVWEGTWASDKSGHWEVEMHFQGNQAVTGDLWLFNNNAPRLGGSVCEVECQNFPIFVLAQTISEESWTLLANVSGTWSIKGRLRDSETMEVVVEHLTTLPLYIPEGSTWTMTRKTTFPKR